MACKVYVYKEFCDADAYGEELVVVYTSVEDAKRRLKDSVEQFVGQTFDALRRTEKACGMDVFDEDYVRITGNRGDSFWVIEECEVVEGRKRQVAVEPRLVATISSHGEDDLSLNVLELPDLVEEKLRRLIKPYCADSVHGTAGDIAKRLLINGKEK